MLINCDIGERGEAHPVDKELLNYIDIANVACGGHAGDRDSVSFFAQEARKRGIWVTAHLSYPDKRNFGRVPMAISNETLVESLKEQLQYFSFIKRVKLHGALYHQANQSEKLALLLTGVFKEFKIEQIIAPIGSEIAKASQKNNINVLYEAFIERRYCIENGHLTLVSRDKPYACIEELDEAISQYEDILAGYVKVYSMSKSGKLSYKQQLLKAQTVCVHSESPIALQLLYRIKALTANA